LRWSQSLSIALTAITALTIGQILLAVEAGADSMAQAESLLRQGHRQEAIKVLHDYVQEHPHDVRAYILLGRTYGENAQIPQAREVLLQAITIAPNSASAHLSLGVVEVLAGHNEAGEKEFQRVLQIQPEDQTALYDLATVWFDEAKYDAALKLFRRYLAHNSSDANALVYTLRCGIATHDPGTVQQAQVQLDAMQFEDTTFHAQMGRWLAEGTFYEEADREFSTAIKAPNAPSELIADYASLLLRESKPQKALQILSRIPEQERENGFYHYLMGQCYERLLDLKAAYREYSEAISIDPSHDVYHLSLSALLVSQKAFAAADRVLSSATARFPNSLTVTVARGFLELEVGTPESAMKYYFRAVQLEPDSSLTSELLGRIEMAKGDYSSALQAFKRAAELAPLDPRPLFLEGLAYTRTENGTDKAIDCFSRSLKLNPELADRYFWLGSLYFNRKHEYKLAEKYLEEAVKRAPNAAAANQMLIQCYRVLGENQKAADQADRYKQAMRQSPPGDDLKVVLDKQNYGYPIR